MAAPARNRHSSLKIKVLLPRRLLYPVRAVRTGLLSTLMGRCSDPVDGRCRWEHERARILPPSAPEGRRRLEVLGVYYRGLREPATILIC